MSILLDSASLKEAISVCELGFVRGITTNPGLMRTQTDDPLRHLEELLTAVDLAEIYYQPTGAYGPWLAEAEKAWSLDQDRVVLKLPATAHGAATAAEMVRRGAAVAFTAAQTAQSMIVAEAIGCTTVIPYLDRAIRDIRTETRILQALQSVRRRPTRILVASVKSVGQFEQAFQDGADAVTAPAAVLHQLLAHPAVIEADQTFAAAYSGR